MYQEPWIRVFKSEQSITSPTGNPNAYQIEKRDKLYPFSSVYVYPYNRALHSYPHVKQHEWLAYVMLKEARQRRIHLDDIYIEISKYIKQNYKVRG